MSNTVEFDNVRKDYGDFTLSGVSFTLPGGCILGLVGENGAGKTTLLKLLLDTVKRDGGKVSVFGKDAAGLDPAVREEIGVVPDEIGLPGHMTAVQIGKMMKKMYRQWDGEAYGRLLKRLDVPEGKKYTGLSHGTKRKLALAAAMAHAPKLLVLDEATNGLDPVVREEVMTLLREFVCDEEHAVLFSSHILEDLDKVCDYAVFLHKGRLLAYDEKDALCDRYGVWRGSREAFEALGKDGVVRAVLSPFGAEAVVERSGYTGCEELGKVDPETLFVALVRQADGMTVEERKA